MTDRCLPPPPSRLPRRDLLLPSARSRVSSGASSRSRTGRVGELLQWGAWLDVRRRRSRVGCEEGLFGFLELCMIFVYCLKCILYLVKPLALTRFTKDNVYRIHKLSKAERKESSSYTAEPIYLHSFPARASLRRGTRGLPGRSRAPRSRMVRRVVGRSARRPAHDLMRAGRSVLCPRLGIERAKESRGSGILRADRLAFRFWLRPFRLFVVSSSPHLLHSLRAQLFVPKQGS